MNLQGVYAHEYMYVFVCVFAIYECASLGNDAEIHFKI